MELKATQRNERRRRWLQFLKGQDRKWSWNTYPNPCSIEVASVCLTIQEDIITHMGHILWLELVVEWDRVEVFVDEIRVN